MSEAESLKKQEETKPKKKRRRAPHLGHPFEDWELDIIRNAAAGGLSIVDTARLLGCDENTIYRHAGKGRALHEIIEMGKADFQNKVMGVMSKKILEQEETTCLLFYLRSKMGWVETTKKEIDLKAQVELGPLLQKMDPVELKKAREALEAKYNKENEDVQDV